MGRSSTDRRCARAALALAILLLAPAGRPAAEPLEGLGLIPTPPRVTAADAIDHVGEVVELETTVATATVEAGRLVLRGADSAPRAVRIVVVPPAIGPSLSDLVERFRGRRVRVRGRVHEFAGDVEILVGDPDRVAVVDAEPRVTSAIASAPGEDAPPATVAAPAPPIAVPPPAERPRIVAAAPSPDVPAPTASPAAERFHAAAPAPTPTPRPVATPPISGTTAAPTPRADADCVAARAAWLSAAAAARAPLARLESCLAGGTPPCADDAAAVRRALGEVAAAEERLRWLCPGEGR